MPRKGFIEEQIIAAPRARPPVDSDTITLEFWGHACWRQRAKSLRNRRISAPLDTNRGNLFLLSRGSRVGAPSP
jgi:hypothetical protein